jgi:hypothetical protein
LAAFSGYGGNRKRTGAGVFIIHLAPGPFLLEVFEIFAVNGPIGFYIVTTTSHSAGYVGLYVDENVVVVR